MQKQNKKQERDKRGRFLGSGATGSATQLPNAPDPNIERAQGIFAKLMLGMTKVADLGAAKAATLVNAIASMGTGRGADSTGIGRQNRNREASASGNGPNRPSRPSEKPNLTERFAADPMKTVLGGALSLFSNKLILILAPLTAFATILNQSSSGFKVFLSAINVFAGTLAPILLPVFILLSAAVLTAADYLWDRLEPALADLYTLIITGAIVGLQGFINWLSVAGNALRAFVSGAGDAADDLTDGFALGLARFLDFFTPGAFGDNLEKAVREDIERRKPARLIPAPGQQAENGRLLQGGNAPQQGGANAANKPPERDFLATFKANLKLSTQELRFQNAPRASFSGLAAASRNAQLAAVNVSPFEKIMEQRMGRSVALLEQIVDKIGRPALVD